MAKTSHQTFPRKKPKDYASQVGPMVSLACYENHHQECKGNCQPLLPFACGCTCHEKKPLTG